MHHLKSPTRKKPRQGEGSLSLCHLGNQFEAFWGFALSTVCGSLDSDRETWCEHRVSIVAAFYRTPSSSFGTLHMLFVPFVVAVPVLGC